jgi:ADP-heptose:LPS heptosyltransferase
MNVLAVRQDNNGDVLLTGPALRALAAGTGRVTLLCGPSGKAAADVLPGVDQVLCYEAGWIEAKPHAVDRRTVDELVGAVAELRIDRAVIFTSFHQSPLPTALLLRCAGIASIAAISEDYPGSLLDVRHRGVPDAIHEVERALSLADAAGFRLPKTDERKLAMRVSSRTPLHGQRSYIVVHPGATVPARAWSVAANAKLVRALIAQGESVVVTGSPSERELCAEVAGTGAIDLCGQTDFATLGRVIADAQAIVVGNTGAAHVAAAVGTPTVSLFAPTIPAVRFRPWLVDHVLLGNQDIPCGGCRARVCPRTDHACLSSVTVDDVLDALRVVRRREVAA